MADETNWLAGYRAGVSDAYREIAAEAEPAGETWSGSVVEAMSDLIERLNGTATGPDHLYSNTPNELLRSAASAIARLRTELEAAKGAVGVKALEWIEARVSSKSERFTASSPVGSYEALKWSDGIYGGSLPPVDDEEAGTEFTSASMEEAKAAAQADFERRIRSALTESDTEARIRQDERERLKALDKFAKWAIREGAFTGGDLGGGEIQDKAVELGLLRGEPYDPERHGDIDDADPGVEIFVFTDLLPARSRAIDAKEG